jgi:hypothetical protein
LRAALSKTPAWHVISLAVPAISAYLSAEGRDQASLVTIGTEHVT